MTMPASVPEAGPGRQDEVNRAVYFARGVYLYYLAKSLMPAEQACLNTCKEHWTGRDVLDIGVGAGRTSRHFLKTARRYAAVDYSPVMVAYLRKKMPQVDVRQADFRDLRVFEDRSFDLVFATANVIDALPHSGRLAALNEASRVLRPGGIFAFSTHNLNYQDAFSGPRWNWSANPLRFAYNGLVFVLGRRNHRRIAPLRTRERDYALLNDPGHFYACLHYYAGRETVREQLRSAGLRLLHVFDRSGRILGETDSDRDQPWLFYSAEREK